mmetsp:Transcript_6223/g.28062  ORF Transcript_6223/g.28062 Transcript_6223/m.28062 type:complete len:258 (+) Transcript_6223:932-1705(+)
MQSTHAPKTKIPTGRIHPRTTTASTATPPRQDPPMRTKKTTMTTKTLKCGASPSNCPTNASPRRTIHTSTATRTPPHTPPCSHGGRWTTWTYTTFTTPATTFYPSIDARRTDSSARSSSAANATTTAFMRTRAWGGGNPRLARRRSRPTRGRGAMTWARRVHKEGTPTVGRGTALKIGKRMIEPALTPPRTATSQAPAGSPSARGSQRQRRRGCPRRRRASQPACSTPSLAGTPTLTSESISPSPPSPLGTDPPRTW